jgi:hypothetical protein
MLLINGKEGELKQKGISFQILAVENIIKVSRHQPIYNIDVRQHTKI